MTTRRLDFLFWQEEEEPRKGFNIAWILTLPHILYFRALQGHSGGIAINPELQDKKLLPKGSIEYIFHVGNASELNSITNEEDNPCSR